MPSSLDREIIPRLQAAIWTLLRRLNPDQPERAQSALAPRLDIDRSQISRILKHGSGGSLQLIQAVARELNIPPEQIIYADGGKPVIRQARELPGFDAALQEVRTRAPRSHPHLTREDIERACDFRGDPEPAEIDADYLLVVANALKRAATRPPKSSTRKSAKRISLDARAGGRAKPGR